MNDTTPWSITSNPVVRLLAVGPVFHFHPARHHPPVVPSVAHSRASAIATFSTSPPSTATPARPHISTLQLFPNFPTSYSSTPHPPHHPDSATPKNPASAHQLPQPTRIHHHLPRGAISCCPFVPCTSSPPSPKTTSIALSKIPQPSSISLSLITNGGTNRNVLVPHVMTSNPRSLAAVTIGVGSVASWSPRRRPLPRTSVT